MTATDCMTERVDAGGQLVSWRFAGLTALGRGITMLPPASQADDCALNDLSRMRLAAAGAKAVVLQNR